MHQTMPLHSRSRRSSKGSIKSSKLSRKSNDRLGETSPKNKGNKTTKNKQDENKLGARLGRRVTKRESRQNTLRSRRPSNAALQV